MQLPPSLRGRYRPRGSLGAGGFGAVVRATDTQMGRDVAIKLLAIEGDDPELRARFAREARTTARLTHPNIVRVYDFSVAPGETPYIVYEFIPGLDLAGWIPEAGPAGPDRLATWMGESAAALAAAHDAGLVHRDLKPANFVVRADGEALVLIDFGIVRSPRGDAWKTATGVILGTPPYLPPEVWRGEKPTAASDQWAWAATMLAAAGGSAYRGREIPEILAELPAWGAGLPARLAGLPPGVAAVLRRALDPDPARRYPGMAAAVAAIGDAAAAAAVPGDASARGAGFRAGRAAGGPGHRRPHAARTRPLGPPRGAPGTADATRLIEAPAGPRRRRLVLGAGFLALAASFAGLGPRAPGRARPAGPPPRRGGGREPSAGEVAAIQAARARLRAALARMRDAFPALRDHGDWGWDTYVSEDRAARTTAWLTPGFRRGFSELLAALPDLVLRLEALPPGHRLRAGDSAPPPGPLVRLILDLTRRMHSDHRHWSSPFQVAVVGPEAMSDRVEGLREALEDLAASAAAGMVRLGGREPRLPSPARRYWGVVYRLVEGGSSPARVIREVPARGPPETDGLAAMVVYKLLTRLESHGARRGLDWDAAQIDRALRDHGPRLARIQAALADDEKRATCGRVLAQVLIDRLLPAGSWRSRDATAATLAGVVSAWAAEPRFVETLSDYDDRDQVPALARDLALLAPLSPPLARAYRTFLDRLPPAARAGAPAPDPARTWRVHSETGRRLIAKVAGGDLPPTQFFASAERTAALVESGRLFAPDLPGDLTRLLDAFAWGVAAVDPLAQRRRLAPAVYDGRLASALIHVDTALEKIRRDPSLSGLLAHRRRPPAKAARTRLRQVVGEFVVAADTRFPAASPGWRATLDFLRVLASATAPWEALADGFRSAEKLSPEPGGSFAWYYLDRWNRELLEGGDRVAGRAGLRRLATEVEPDLERWDRFVRDPDSAGWRARTLKTRARTLAALGPAAPAGLAARALANARRFAAGAVALPPRDLRNEYLDDIIAVTGVLRVALGSVPGPADRAAIEDAIRVLAGPLATAEAAPR